MVVSTSNKQSTIITLSPNRSATWQETKLVIMGMVTIVMIIAIAWSFVGAWFVLPFAGLEVGLFAFLMHRVSRFTYSQQIITIAPQRVTVTFGYRKHTLQGEFSRKHLDVYYSETDNHWDLPKIAICAGSRKLLIGEFLNLEDRILLKETLQNAGIVICRNQWWKV